LFRRTASLAPFLGLAALGAALGAAGTSAAAEATLTILYPEMEPSIVTDAATGRPRGPVVDRVEEVARQAGVALTWVGPLPRARILADLEGSAGCTPNAVATPERQASFKFTDPIFPAPRWVVLVRRDAGWVDGYARFADLLADPERVFGRLLGASFGPPVDRMVAGAGENTRQLRGTPGDLMRLLAASRLDYILLAANDLDHKAATLDVDMADYRVVEFPDLKAEAGGRFMCARSVGDAVLDRLNGALRKSRRRG